MIRRRRITTRWTVGAILALTWLVAVTVMTTVPSLFPFLRGADEKVRIAGKLQSNYKLGPSWDAWWGVDRSSFDIFARCIHYARNSLLVGVSATAIGLTVGGALGIAAGYFRGWVDRVVSIIIDCLLSIPALVLAIMLVSRLNDVRADLPWLGWATRRWQVILALSVLAVAPLARITRAQTMALREREFVLAARSLGASAPRVIVKEILPNLVPTMVTVATTGLGLLIAAEGTLAFLGVGLGESWGVLIEANRRRLDKAWWAAVFPCLMLFVTVMSFNVLGDRLAKRFDIREAGV